MEKKRILITTALEETWVFDQPVMFLGEWCRRYERRHIWEEMDAVVAPPYGLGKQKKDEDHALVESIIERLFPPFYKILNEYHKTNHDLRFWTILLGHWFGRVVRVIFNRYQTLHQAMSIYSFSEITGIEDESYSLATSQTEDFLWATNDNYWNSVLYSRIAQKINHPNIVLCFISLPVLKNKSLNINSASNHLLEKIKKLLFYANDLRRRNAPLIQNTFLKKELFLNLLFFQLPRFAGYEQMAVSRLADLDCRKKLKESLRIKEGEKIEEIISEFIFDLLPVCFLEAFEELVKYAEKKKYPKNPRFLFTSNDFDTNESFKLFAAQCVEKGIPYYVGQHGNNYGTYRWYMCPSVEEKTSDNFLTWGWSDGLRQHIPAFRLNLKNKKTELNKKKHGGLLVITVCKMHGIETWDVDFDFYQNFENIKLFLKNIQPLIGEETTIRLHRAFLKFEKCEDRLLSDSGLAFKCIDRGTTEIAILIQNSRLVVHAYDSTGILESLSTNTPMLAFWQNGFDHLRDSAVPYYQLLVDAGIVHLSPESAAEKVNAIWDDIPTWWNSPKVQQARKQFCDRYARTSKTPVRDIYKILTSNLQNQKQNE